jgi:hypothetical protein
MKFGWMMATGAALLMSQSAMAQTAPRIAGPYLLNYTVICQEKGSGSPSNLGSITQNTGMAGFNASNGTVVINGFSDSGSIFDNTSGGGTAMAESAWTKNLTFTVTPTTLTLTSGFGSQVYNLVFTPSAGTGAATAFMFNGVLTASPTCTAQGTAILQTAN